MPKKPSHLIKFIPNKRRCSLPFLSFLTCTDQGAISNDIPQIWGPAELAGHLLPRTVEEKPQLENSGRTKTVLVC